MDLELVKKGLDFTQRRKKWVLVFAAFGFTSYGVYRVYHLPSVMEKRRRLYMLLGTLISIAESVSDSAETIGLVSKDLKEFLQSNSDQIPNSLKQISKITRSGEFSDSITRVTRALTVGVLRGYQSLGASNDHESNGNSSFLDRVMDKITSPAGTGFASIVVGSFARNLVMAFYTDKHQNGESNLKSSTGGDCLGSKDSSSLPRWVVDVVCDDKCKELIGNCIQLFVSSAVSVYLEKTMNINTYDEFFSGLTNPNHKTKVRDVLVSVCNGAVETLVKTSHQVLTNSDSDKNSSSVSSYLAINHPQGQAMNGYIGQESLPIERRGRNSFDETKDNNGFATILSTTLAAPINRSFVLDVTGRVTFETVRSFLEFLLENVAQGLKGSINAVHEVVIVRGIEAFRCMTAKSSAIVTVCLSLCLQVMGGAWVLIPA